MNENDFQIIYDGLLKMLRGNAIGLNRIANRVEEIVEEGKIVKEKVQVELDDMPSNFADFKNYKFPRKSTRNLYRKVEYTGKEKLTFLLDTIEAAVINPTVIRQEITKIFAKQADKTSVESQDVYLYPSLATNEDLIILTANATSAEVERLTDLMRWIGNLREEIENDYSQ